MKCLEKDRNRRYETANGLSHDIERYLHDEPVHACPPSTVYRFRKFAKRNRTPLATGTLLMLALLVALGAIASGIWERRARQSRVTGQLELILDEVARLEREEKWNEALATARRVEPTLAAGEAAPEIQRRAQKALADLEFVRRLEETRAESGTVWGTRDRTSIPLAARADQEYSAAFREAGIDVDTLPVKEAVERIAGRGQIAAAVLPALDDWVAVRSTVKNEAGTRRLIDVLQTADPDSWRQQVRDCLARKDWPALENLAKSPDLDRQPAATIGFLSAALRAQAESDTDRSGEEQTELGPRGFFLEIDILRRAQQRYPADYWINHRLGTTLIGMKTPELVQEGIGFLRAAAAVRPQNTDLIITMASGYEHLGQYDQVLAYCRRATELAPQDARTFNGAAWALLTSGEAALRHSDDALQSAQKAVKLAPQDGAIWNTLGVAQYRAGDWNGAIDSLQKSLELQDDNGYDFFVLAMTHWQLGSKEQAREWYDRAVEWAANRSTKSGAWEELRHFRAEADALLKIDAEKTAIDEVDAWENAAALTERVRLRVRQGNFRQAADNYAKAIELQPPSELAWLQCGSLLAYVGDREAFRKHCAAMLERFGNTQDRNVAERTAKLMSCVPTDVSGIDPQRIVALADRALSSDSPHQDLQWFHLAKGMADYRAGQFNSVALSMNKAKTAHSPVRTVLADLYMAMAQFQLGDREASVKTLDGALSTMTTLPQPGRDDLGEHFHDYLFCHLVHREAEALILKSAQEPSTDKSKTTVLSR
jgi:tetratricopeptide (TPR) repeat protein